MRGLVAVFERYLPGSERVALLLNAMGITTYGSLCHPHR
jgi:hypothetical protein